MTRKTAPMIKSAYPICPTWISKTVLLTTSLFTQNSSISAKIPFFADMLLSLYYRQTAPISQMHFKCLFYSEHDIYYPIKLPCPLALIVIDVKLNIQFTAFPYLRNSDMASGRPYRIIQPVIHRWFSAIKDSSKFCIFLPVIAKA